MNTRASLLAVIAVAILGLAASPAHADSCADVAAGVPVSLDIDPSLDDSEGCTLRNALAEVRGLGNSCGLPAQVSQLNIRLTGTEVIFLHDWLGPYGGFEEFIGTDEESQGLIELGLAALQGDLDIPPCLAVSINGNGSTLSGGLQSRIFDLAPGSSLELLDLTLQLGVPAQAFPGDSPHGGAVRVGAGASLSADGVLFNYNTAYYGHGGAIYANNAASLQLVDSEFTLNESDYYGGAIAAFSAAPLDVMQIDVSRVLFDRNEAEVSGGAVLVGYNIDLSVTNATFSRNKADAGSAIYANTLFAWAGWYTNIDVRHTTFADNHKIPHPVVPIVKIDVPAVQTLGVGSAVSISGSILAGGVTATTGGPGIVSGGYNLSSDASLPPAPSDLQNLSAVQLGLLPLANNGGPARSIALQPASLAVNIGVVTAPAVTVDQRSFPRDASPDAGSFELSP